MFSKKVFAVGLVIILGVLLLFSSYPKKVEEKKPVKQYHWFLLHRKANKEEFFLGNPGDTKNSQLVKTFRVKTGIPGERPTPLPTLMGRKYWIMTEKSDAHDNPETAPYFLTLNIPSPQDPPYGPVPYMECNGQCNWILPGAFGLHGIAAHPERLTVADPGSSGCIRHNNEDITYLYNTVDPKNEEIRYYIEDN